MELVKVFNFPSKLPGIILIIFWDFLMFYQVFFSPQVKRCTIFTYKHGIYELPHELPNEYQESVQISWNDSLVLSLLVKMKILLVLAKISWKQKLNFSRSALFNMKTRVSLRYFVNDCLWKHFLSSNSPQTPSNLIYFSILLTVRPFTQL